MYLFFDTETNGKPKRYGADFREVDNWPRITQLAYAMLDNDGIAMYHGSTLVAPDGWEIPKEKFFIDNNMSTERCQQEGLLIRNVLEDFMVPIHECEVMVAHNLAFDLPVIQAEMLRLNMKAGKRPEKYCTMLGSKDILKLPGKYDFKWPKLEELHKFLFNCDFDGAHDALNDVMATAKCFFELKKRGLITI